jgi:Fe-S-cluster containining protein
LKQSEATAAGATREAVHERLERVRSLHRAVDEAVAPLERIHADRLRCRRGCSDCCVDGLTVFEVEAELIRASHSRMLEDDPPHPAGACAMLDADGSCRIYEHRPYVCRTQGLPLRWVGERDGESVEWRDVCPLNEVPGEPVESLDAGHCWTLGPFEGRLAALQAGASPTGEPDETRVALRDLFTRPGA